MLKFFDRICKKYDQIWNSRDIRLNHMPLMGTPLPVLLIVSAYLLIVGTGKKWMKHRQPMKIERIIIVYNFIQIFANSTLVLMITHYIFILNPDFSFRCEPVNFFTHFKGMYLFYMGYGCFILKLIDYFDTVFFVLRKKWTQVSFLHVYHHVMISMIGYVALLYAPGGQAILFVYVNCFIHAIMYTYYLISICNPMRIRSCITMKKIITQLQIIQFFIMIVHFGHGFIIPGHDCSYPKGLSFLMFTQNLCMIVLFTKFYRKAYGQKRNEQKIQ